MIDVKIKMKDATFKATSRSVDIDGDISAASLGASIACALDGMRPYIPRSSWDDLIYQLVEYFLDEELRGPIAIAMDEYEQKRKGVTDEDQD